MRARKYLVNNHSSSKRRIHKNKGSWKKLFVGIIIRLGIITLVLAGGYALFVSNFFQISHIETRGARELDEGRLENLVRDQMKGNYFYFIRKNNFIFVDSKAIEKTLSDEFRKIEEVNVNKKFPNRLVISFREKEPALIVCGYECYVADASGKIYDEINPESEEDQELQKLPVLRDGSNKVLQLQDIVLNSDYIEYFRNAQEKLKSDLGIESEREWFTPQLVSGDIRAKTKDGWSIYFDENISLEKEINMLRVVLDKKIEKEKRADLEYIDLRTDNKVYYKYKTSQVSQEEQQPVQETKTEKTDSEKKNKKKD